MRKVNITKRISDLGIMSVIRADPERTLEIVKAGYEGGVKLVEISFTVPTAEDSIKLLKRELPDVLVGAGTVLDSETARIAILDGADFLLSPAYSEEVALIANRYQVPYLPGCNSVTEAVSAMTYGAAFVKVFPGSALEGPNWINVVKTPIPDMPILASGGGTIDNFKDFLAAGADCVAFGGILAKGTSEEIKQNAIKLNIILNDYRQNR